MPTRRPILAARSLSGFGGRVEDWAVQGQVYEDLRIYSGSIDRESTEIGAAQSNSQAGQPTVRQAPSIPFSLATANKPAADTAPRPPTLSEQTLNSGGTMPAEQARVHLAHAEPHFSIDLPQHCISGNATLTFTAKTASDIALLDLDQTCRSSGWRLAASR